MSTSDPLLYDKTATGRGLEPWFSKHMMAMTAEGLHAKSEIAAELARRDKELEALRASLADALCALDWYKEKSGGYDDRS